jgi:hypothetical protein
MNQTPSAAAQILVAVIPTVGIVAGSVVIFFWMLWAHRQRMLMIEKDQLQRRSFDLQAFSLLTGLLLFGIGASLMLFFLLKEGLSYGVLSGIIPLSIGASLIVFFIIRRNMRRDG